MSASGTNSQGGDVNLQAGENILVTGNIDASANSGSDRTASGRVNLLPERGARQLDDDDDDGDDDDGDDDDDDDGWRKQPPAPAPAPAPHPHQHRHQRPH
ncbi:MAG: hypothetical protein HC942_27185, partial [Microcoleus sp. SU_5_6]|nr:hypothetical protein [Microcoleus sp. SU_5_6]